MATATEKIQLRTRTGTTSDATASVTRHSAGFRLARSVGIAVGGLVVGAASILIPVVHLISTWAIPLTGLAVAALLYRQREIVGAARGTCPKCAEAIEVQGGTQAEDLWVACPKCGEPLRFELAPEPRPV